jgi:hypothetical protein
MMLFKMTGPEVLDTLKSDSATMQAIAESKRAKDA